jgi:pimeloyl-ACP methyl ester carboxylesterase
MPLELVRAATPDGLKLDGALHLASETSAVPSVDLAICLHGVSSNFYAGGLFEQLVQPLTTAGVAVLRVNTRGRDNLYAAASKMGRRWLGAAFEIVDECRYDILGWLEFARERGFRRIALVGHSLGAIKALYAAAHEQLTSVERIIAISPPRLSYSHFNNGLDSARFFETYATADALVKRGEPSALFVSGFPFPLYITAAGYIDKYGPAERYNFFKFLDRISQPLHFIYGQRELEQNASAFAGIVDAIRAVKPAATVTTIPDADHYYTARHDALAETVTAWLLVTP